MRRFVLLLLLVAAMSAFGITAVAQDEDAAEETEAQTPAEICEAATPAEEPESREYEGTERVLEFGVDYYAVFCTEFGPVYVDLFETYAPATVNNFVFLAEDGYYNNTTFHRVLQDFMAQGGDPTATGSGGPGYNFPDEIVSFLTFDRPGLLAMANANRPEQGVVGTNGSQFFLTTVTTDWLNYRHTIFGEVLEGQTVVESIPLRDPSTATDPGPALDAVVIVTDPSTVAVEIASDDVEAVVAEDFSAALDTLPELPPVFQLDEERSGVYTSEELLELEADAPEAFGEALETFNHDFTFTTGLVSVDCDLEAVPYEYAGYTVHVFETRADASEAALSDDLAVLASVSDEEFETVEGGNAIGPVFVREAEACGEAGQQGFMVRQDGRFLIVSEILIPEGDFGAELWLEQVVNGIMDPVNIQPIGIFDHIFGELLVRELRNR